MNKKLLLSMAFCLTAILLTACGDDSNSSSANTPDLLYPTSVGLVYSDNTVRDAFGNVIGVYDAATNVVTLFDGTVISLNEDGSIVSSSSSEKIEAKSSSSVEQEESSSSQEVESSSSFTGNVDKPNWAYLNPNINYGMFTDSRDGQVYKTVKIGTQIWMAENLNYSDSVKTPSLKEHSWCYENSADSCAKYGRLYTWVAAIDSVALSAEGDTCGYGTTCTLPEKVQGICPEGWHLPTKAEWNDLYDYIYNDSGLSENTDVGTYLKSPVGWEEDSDTPVGLDTYGFAALPAGYRNKYGYFDYAGNSAYFWSATEHKRNYVFYRNLDYNYEYFYSSSSNKNLAYSVRCLKD